MKKIRQWCGFGLLLMGLAGVLPLQAQSYEKLWKQVEQAGGKSLPQTVIRLTDEICRKAEREKNVPQLLKASLWRDHVQEQLTPDSFYVHLAAWEKWARTEENPVNRAILHSLLARCYAGYLQSHARTARPLTPLLPEEAPADIREWSANLFVDAIDRHLCEALKEPSVLQETSSASYLPFVEQEEGSLFYGHDMYHLLARRAVYDYNNLMNYGADSLARQRVRAIYEGMIQAYRARPDREDAALLAALDYWDWRTSEGLRPEQRMAGGDVAVGLQEEEYLKELDRLIETYRHRQTCAEAYLQKARRLQQNGGRTAAIIQVCDEALRRYPSYKRINELKNLRASLLRPVLNIRIPESGGYPGDTLSLGVRHQNGGGDFTLRLYATNLPEYPLFDSDKRLNDYKKYITRAVASRRYSLSTRPLRAGEEEADRPYLQSDTTLLLPLPSEVGTYVLQIVPTKNAVPRENVYFLSVSRFRALVLGVGNRQTELLTVDARSGQPVPGVSVCLYRSKSRREENPQPAKSVTTGDDGKLILPYDPAICFYAVRHGKDTGTPVQYFATFDDKDEKRETDNLTLLTDRALYRPGQTVYVKGIAYRARTREAEVLADAKYELSLRDASGKELSTQTVKTNGFGSFFAEFALPTVCLNGHFQIEAKGVGSSVGFRVEEYKRPTFEITFNPLSNAYAIGDRVVLEGSVKAYNGISLQDVPLAYTLVRRERYGYGREISLKADTVRLDVQGGFSLPVELVAPDGGVGPNTLCTYSVEVAVTSEGGETQQAVCTLQATAAPFRLVDEIPGIVCREENGSRTIRALNLQHRNLTLDATYRLLSLPDSVCRREGGFVTGVSRSFEEWNDLPSGLYCLRLAARDSLGREVTTDKELQFFSRHDTRPAFHTPFFLVEEQTEMDASRPASFFVGTSFRNACLQMDIFSGGKRIENRPMQLNDTLVHVVLPYQEAYGERCSVLLRLIRNGQLYEQTVDLDRPSPEKKLDLKWEVFRDRLQPGQEEEWKLVIKTPEGAGAAAELLALMYDASLDKIYSRLQPLRVLYPSTPYYYIYRYCGNLTSLYYAPYFTVKDWPFFAWQFDRFCMTYPNRVQLMNTVMTRNGARAVAMVIRDDELALSTLEEIGVSTEIKYVAPQAADSNLGILKRAAGGETAAETEEVGTDRDADAVADTVLSPASSLRTNFAETAFFYPQLRTNEQGEVAFSFTMPQSLTRWNFHGYAHTRDMQVGELAATAVTSKEFMLTPNLPRFLRTGDRTQLAASVANLTEGTVKGTVQLTLFDPQTEKVLLTRKEKFTAEAGRSATVGFRFDVPRHEGLLAVRLVADGGRFSDGEQHLLPVLSDRQFVTETLPLPIRGGETRTFTLDTLFNRRSATATDRRLTVEFTGNPAWYAVQALPVIGQPTANSAIEWGISLYANTLAGYIADSQPRIRTMIESWRQAGGSRETFLSKLQQNQELKEILLDESPWLMEARSEAEQQARIATLFDLNRQRDRYQSALAKLKELQNKDDGSWSWYNGMCGSRYVTTYVTTLLVRLSQLTGRPLDAEAAAMKQQAFRYLYQGLQSEYESALAVERRGGKVDVPSALAVDCLYLTALDGTSVPQVNRAAYDYFLNKVNALLTSTDLTLKSQAAVILYRTGRKADAAAFAASLREHLVQEEEVGAHFAFLDRPYGWGMLPVPTHVAAMEALRETGADPALLEEMKLWLLKQKQTLSWDSPVSTADAVYALLCQGNDWLENRGDVRITLGKQVLETQDAASAPLPGLAYVKTTYGEDSPALKARTVTVEKRDDGVAWGALYAQFLSPISDLRQQGDGLSVKKQLYVERVGADGRKSLQPLFSADGKSLSVSLHVGDKIVTRLVITLDRAMDFLQLKDSRSACLEPLSVLSGYRWSNGLGYYIEPGDVSTCFFFDHLGKGTYVLEHAARIARSGTYETGLATLQSAYAPEFTAHSSGGKLVIE